jgi:membrane protein
LRIPDCLKSKQRRAHELIDGTLIAAMARLSVRFILDLLKQTTREWIDDEAPQLGAALAFYSVFSLAPLVLLALALIGVFFRNDPAGAWSLVIQQMSYFLDSSGIHVVQDIAQHIASPKTSALGGVIGLALALFGVTGVFSQLQYSLNVIWGVKAKRGGGIWGFVQSRFLSFALLAGIAFLLLVSLVIEARRLISVRPLTQRRHNLKNVPVTT